MGSRVALEWRKGPTGLGGTYRFNPKPNITRESPTLKQAEFDIPLSDGVQIQTLGKTKRTITLSGTLVAKSKTFEDLEDMRINLINGIGTNEGQLHIISLNALPNSKHIFYNGIPSQEGIRFKEQSNPIFLDYDFTIICADPDEYVNSVVQTVVSNAKVV